MHSFWCHPVLGLHISLTAILQRGACFPFDHRGLGTQRVRFPQRNTALSDGATSSQKGESQVHAEWQPQQGALHPQVNAPHSNNAAAQLPPALSLLKVSFNSSPQAIRGMKCMFTCQEINKTRHCCRSLLHLLQPGDRQVGENPADRRLLKQPNRRMLFTPVRD